MPVVATAPYSTATGNGVSTSFPFSFACRNAADVAVYVNGVVQTSGYSVTIGADFNSGTILFATPPASNASIFIASQPSLAQTIAFENAGPYNPSTVDGAFDAAAIRGIYLAGLLARTAIAPIGETMGPYPAMAVRAGMYLAFDANGNPVASAGTGGGDASLRTDLAAASGAALVGFQAPGAAVTRSIAKVLSDRASIKDRGAAGDGVTNDTNALLAAVSAGVELRLPPGNYLIDGAAFTSLPSVRIIGAGRDVTKITLRTSGTALTFSNCQWLQISDLSIQTQGTAQSLANSTAIQFDTGSNNSVIERVNIYGFSFDGIRYVGLTGVNNHLSGHTLRDVDVLGCGRNQIYGNFCDDFTFDNIQCGILQGVTHAQYGIYLDTCGEGQFEGIKVWNNQRGLNEINCTGLRHSSARVELSDFENVYISGGYDLLFDGCRFYSPSQSGNGGYDNFYDTNSQRTSLIGCNINTWDATFGRWAVNFDVGCDDMTVHGNTMGGFSTSYGPINFNSSITRVSGDLIIPFNSTAVAAGSTIYPSVAANTAEAAAWRVMNRQYAVARLYAAVDVAPGAGKNFTYSVRKNAADPTTAMSCQVSGTATAAGVNTTTPQLLLDAGDIVNPKLITDAGAAVVNHRGYLVLVEY